MSAEIAALIDQCASARGADPELDKAVSRRLKSGYVMPVSGDLNGCYHLCKQYAPGWMFTLTEDAQGPNVWMYNRAGLTAGGRGLTLWGAFLAATLIAHSKIAE